MNDSNNISIHKMIKPKKKEEKNKKDNKKDDFERYEYLRRVLQSYHFK